MQRYWIFELPMMSVTRIDAYWECTWTLSYESNECAYIHSVWYWTPYLLLKIRPYPLVIPTARFVNAAWYSLKWDCVSSTVRFFCEVLL